MCSPGKSTAWALSCAPSASPAPPSRSVWPTLSIIFSASPGSRGVLCLLDAKAASQRQRRHEIAQKYAAKPGSDVGVAVTHQNPTVFRGVQLGVQGLDGIGSVDDPPDFVGGSEKPYDLRPCPAPTLADGRIALPPEARFEGRHRFLGGRGIDSLADGLHPKSRMPPQSGRAGLARIRRILLLALVRAGFMDQLHKVKAIFGSR